MIYKEKSNPAFGMLGFNRVSGGDGNLFGSSIKHDHKIQLTLKEGFISRELNKDWYFGGKTLFKVEMSYTQFAELISSMSVGSGVPVTIRYTKENGATAPIETIFDTKKQFLDEFKKENDQALSNAKEITEKLTAILSEKRTIKASEREEIMSLLTQLHNAVDSGNTYMLDQFSETAEKITTEAKGEVEAFVQNKMNSIALAAITEKENLKEIADNVPRIEETDNTPPNHCKEQKCPWYDVKHNVCQSPNDPWNGECDFDWAEECPECHQLIANGQDDDYYICPYCGAML